MLRSALLALALACVSPFGQHAAAQEGTIRIVLGFPAGASSDLLTRLLAGQMRAAVMKRDYEKWGPIIKASGFKPEN